MRISTLATSVALSFILFFSGCKKEDTTEHKVWKTYNASNGMCSDNLNSVCEGNNGEMFFGHQEGGITRLKDGKFEKYSLLPGAYVWSIYKRKNGDILAGLTGGVFKFDGSSWNNLNIGTTLFLSIFEDSRSQLWFGLSSGLYNYTTKGGWASKDTTENDLVWSMAEGKGGEMYAMGFGKKLLVGNYNNQDLSFYSTDTINTLTFGTPKVSKQETSYWVVYRDSKDNLWFGTFCSRGLVKYDAILKKYTVYDVQKVVSIKEDKNGNLWIASYGAGLVKLGNDGVVNPPINDKPGMDKIVGICIDGKENIWLATWKTGVIEYIP